MAKSPEEALQTMIANMPEKTGKSLDDWLVVASASGLEKHGQIVKHLKSEHGMTHGFANLVAAKAREGDAAVTANDLLVAQYEKKPNLRPLYDQLIAEVTEFGDDLEPSVKKTYVSLRRNKQFAIAQPSTKTRLDVGLNLAGVEPAGRLEASGSFSGMCTHRVRVTAASDIDDELIGWLRDAYEGA